MDILHFAYAFNTCRTFGLLQFLAMMNNNAAMTTHIQVFVWMCVFNYLGYIPRSKIPESFIIHFNFSWQLTWINIYWMNEYLWKNEWIKASHFLISYCQVCYKIYQFSEQLVWKLLSHVRFFETPWTIQSMEFSRSEYWSG